MRQAGKCLCSLYCQEFQAGSFDLAVWGEKKVSFFPVEATWRSESESGDLSKGLGEKRAADLSSQKS